MANSKINLTVDEKIMIGCTAVVLISGIWMYQERVQIRKEQARLNTMLNNINAASIMSANAIRDGNHELIIGNQMLRSMIIQNAIGSQKIVNSEKKVP